MVKIHALVVGRLQTNCYILQSDSTGLIIDPGDEPERIIRFLRDTAIKPSQIIATHTHFDHVLGVSAIRNALNIPFLIHRDDLPMLESMQKSVRQFMGISVPAPPKVDRFLVDGESITLGRDTVRVLHTPGHSPGSISIEGQGYVFTGDALFRHSIGRTDLPGGNLDILIRSITNRLFTLEDGTLVYPGHGLETSVGDERIANPFVGRVSQRTS